MNYRQRCYDSYGLHWKQFHSLKPEEYELYSKTANKKLRRFLPHDKSAKILDVACGSGHFLYFLKKEGYTNIHGIDLSDDQLEVARRTGLTEVVRQTSLIISPNIKKGMI
jgi:2-polyprenyl-3-methyl-5-hydroxy-6-metoxy-1,4-benzoquinol methylase